MQNEPIDLELSDSDTDTDSKIVRPVEESTEISHHTITTSKVVWESEVERGRKLEQNRYDLSVWNGTHLTILST
jgi:hypothetical protein